MSICLFVYLSMLSRLNHLTYDLGIQYKSHYQSKMFVCVFVISGRMLIIAQMRSITFYFDERESGSLILAPYLSSNLKVLLFRNGSMTKKGGYDCVNC